MTPRTPVARTAVALILGAVLVLICYYWVDRPVARFVHDHGSFLSGFLQWPPLISNWLKSIAPLAIVLAVLWWVWRPGRLQTVLLAISANLVVTVVLKQFLKWCCGRYWPETWAHDNPSLIGSGAYGFHPFQHGTAYDSFPSGHAAVTCCVLSILWLSYPDGDGCMRSSAGPSAWRWWG